jgi:hypothetical protein
MDDLDLSELTEDQIVGLATALAREALRRNPATAAAFEAALVTERERVEIELKASQAQKDAELRRLREVAQRAAEQQAHEIVQQHVRNALAIFVRHAAQLVGRDVSDVTLVYGGGFHKEGPRLQLNQGVTGEFADWHLVDYCTQTQAIKTSWALERKRRELLVWAKETAAAAKALDVKRIIIKGIEL